MKKFQSNTGFKYLPIWFEEGAFITDSRDILKTMGQRYGYYPDDKEQAVLVDKIVDLVHDTYETFYLALSQKKNWSDKVIQSYLNQVKKIFEFLDENCWAHDEKAHVAKFIAGTDSPTIADFMLTVVFFAFIFPEFDGKRMHTIPQRRDIKMGIRELRLKHTKVIGYWSRLWDTFNDTILKPPVWTF